MQMKLNIFQLMFSNQCGQSWAWWTEDKLLLQQQYPEFLGMFVAQIQLYFSNPIFHD